MSGGFPPVRRVLPDDVRHLSASLARAFVDDPVSSYIFAAQPSRRRRLERYFAFQLRAVFLQVGEAYATGDLAAGALWIPPRQHRPPTFGQAVAQLPIVLVLGSALVRGTRLVGLLERHHPRSAHYYLATIGTDPSSQGAGRGSALMSEVLKRCDAQSIPSYLESSKESNVSFYERHGYEVIEEVTLEGTQLRLWLMWREPDPRRSEPDPRRPEPDPRRPEPR
ncbi:MAG: GNAT family N-acetyltransferase [Acidimicrobiales bacterium]